MLNNQFKLDINNEIIIDNFAGGGGASTGIELALGRHVDIAINHDAKAIAMHTANHPQTQHYCESVWDVDPREVSQGRPIGLVWLSPDCKHFSKAKGGKPVEKKIRGLAWVGLKWASLPNKPRIIMLENVEEFVTWGPLDDSGKPCKKNKGREFNAFVNALKRHGYTVEYKELRACDYGAPTIRKRFFLIARCDGQPIVWPMQTHFDPKLEETRKRKRGEKKRQPWRTAAECIDWSIPCPSIFERKKPLADNTLRRVAKGIMRYVVNAADPFIVTMSHGEGAGKTKRWGQGVRSKDEPLPTVTASGGYGVAVPFISEHANASNQRNMPADEPLRTQCAQVKGGHFSVVAPVISTYYGPKSDKEVRGASVETPLHTQTTENRHAVVSAFMTKFNTGSVGYAADTPAHTIIAGGKQKRPGTAITQGIVTSNMVKMRGNEVGYKTDSPMHTITAGGFHHAEVRSFLIKYYGQDQNPKLQDPLHTITTKERFALVTVQGEVYKIIDIGLRMLQPRELFKAQGFPDGYIIGDDEAQGLKLTKTEQVRMVGNSVSPPLAQALVEANLNHMKVSIAA